MVEASTEVNGTVAFIGESRGEPGVELGPLNGALHSNFAKSSIK